MEQDAAAAFKGACVVAGFLRGRPGGRRAVADFPMISTGSEPLGMLSGGARDVDSVRRWGGEQADTQAIFEFTVIFQATLDSTVHATLRCDCRPPPGDRGAGPMAEMTASLYPSPSWPEGHR